MKGFLLLSILGCFLLISPKGQTQVKVDSDYGLNIPDNPLQLNDDIALKTRASAANGEYNFEKIYSSKIPNCSYAAHLFGSAEDKFQYWKLRMEHIGHSMEGLGGYSNLPEDAYDRADQKQIVYHAMRKAAAQYLIKNCLH